jgi:hypothetical protein
LHYRGAIRCEAVVTASVIDRNPLRGKDAVRRLSEELRRRDGWPNLKDDELDGGVPLHDD